jgi:hypothetical protein
MYHAGALNPVQRQFFEEREPEALYDLDKDPFETTNLADTPGYREALLEMRRLLTDWIREMPDLSFYPENMLYREAFSHPTLFGQSHKNRISDLIDIADLGLLPFEEAREGISKALHSGDVPVLYWGLIVCTIFGNEASPFFDRARQLLDHPDLLVRTRAAEFLALTGVTDPVPVITGALTATSDPREALLVLNTLVLLKDVAGYHFDLKELGLHPGVIGDAEVGRRIEYLSSGRSQTKNL